MIRILPLGVLLRARGRLTPLCPRTPRPSQSDSFSVSAARSTIRFWPGPQGGTGPGDTDRKGIEASVLALGTGSRQQPDPPGAGPGKLVEFRKIVTGSHRGLDPQVGDRPPRGGGPVVQRDRDAPGRQPRRHQPGGNRSTRPAGNLSRPWSKKGRNAKVNWPLARGMLDRKAEVIRATVTGRTRR
ncbi:MAG: hypothetical protein Ct9H300mP1_28350 [Planctomycetaceae bacterium]|nr:MAG: hypothetical protein Ct9H300mP1_28350 [Planctomycetaceae bacterium]